MTNTDWKKVLLAFLAAFGITAGAKAANTVAQNAMRGNAKFNVVAVVLGIIFTGIAIFLFRLDRKVSKLEKDRENQK